MQRITLTVYAGSATVVCDGGAVNNASVDAVYPLMCSYGWTGAPSDQCSVDAVIDVTAGGRTAEYSRPSV